MSKLPRTISNFAVLPISYSPSVTHIIYARPHETSESTKSKTLPEGRTLFLVNVPPDATERELILLFKDAGVVEKVLFSEDWVEEELDKSDTDHEETEDTDTDDEQPEENSDWPRKKQKLAKSEQFKAPTIIPLPSVPLRKLRRSGGSAHVVFLDASSVSRALAYTTPRPWPRSPEEPLGLEHYVAFYDAQRPPLDAIRQHADSYMDAYEYEVDKNKQKSKYRKGEAIVDEDGFTLVTRGGAYGQTLGGGVAVASKKFEENAETTSNKRKKKKGPSEKDNFYAFQKADNQRKGTLNALSCLCRILTENISIAVMEMKKKWDEDQAKIRELRNSRRFKPY
jgi:ribosomal RNA-processing protein 7